MENQRKLSKEEFLGTNFGETLIDLTTMIDLDLNGVKKLSYMDMAFLRVAARFEIHEAQWKVFSQLIEWNFGEKYYFVRNSEKYGIANKDLSDWLVIYNRRRPDTSIDEVWRVVL